MILLTLGWEFVAIIGLALLVGWGLDHIFATSPLFIALFLALGAIGGFLKIFYMLRRWLEGEDKGDKT